MATDRILKAIIFTSLCFGVSARREKVPQANFDLNRTIVIQQVGSSSGSHFGLSLSLVKDPNPTNNGWIFIGAPKSNFSLDSTKFAEPGVVWRCGLRDGSGNICQHLPITQHLCSEKVKEETRTCNGSFVGGSIASGREFLIACAPTWHKFRTKDVTFNRMEGACYFFSSNAAISPNIPVSDRNKLEPFYGVKGSAPFNKGSDVSKFVTGSRSRFFYGEAGFSSHITSAGDVVLGTPGVVGWKGGLYRFNTSDPQGRKGLLLSEYYNKIAEEADRFEYLGYAVTSGKYWKDAPLLIAASAPTSSPKSGNVSANLAGTVFLVAPGEFQEVPINQLFNDGRKWKASLVIDGDQFGSYFGAALESVDLNGDQVDELLVGAPFYHEAGDGDHGSVYVYKLQKGGGLSGVNPLKITANNVSRSRFGSSIAKLGDINQDGYDDVAIGAPYENNRGAVYIFYGGKGGIIPWEFFRIEASHYRENSVGATGFGYSIVGGVDIDGNGIPDFAVGSYLSRTTDIFRMRPNMTITPHTTFSTDDTSLKPVTILPRFALRFQITLCPQIKISTALERQSDLVIVTSVVMDERFHISTDPQISSQTSTSSPSSILASIPIPPKQKSACLTLHVTRNSSSSDAGAAGEEDEQDVVVKEIYSYSYDDHNTPALLTLNISDSQSGQDQLKSTNFGDFCPSCPFATSVTARHEMQFESDCKSQVTNADEECKPDLHLTLAGIDGRQGSQGQQLRFVMMLGEIPTFMLSATVLNRNQTAHDPWIRFHWKWGGWNWETETTPLPTLNGPDGCIAVNSSRVGMEIECPLKKEKNRLKTNETRILNLLVNMNSVIAEHDRGLWLEFVATVYLRNKAAYKNVTESFKVPFRTYNVSLELTSRRVTQNITGMATELRLIFPVNLLGVTPVTPRMRFLIPTKAKVGRVFQNVLSVQPLPGDAVCNSSTPTDLQQTFRSSGRIQNFKDEFKDVMKRESSAADSVDVVSCMEAKAGCLQYDCVLIPKKRLHRQFEVSFQVRMDAQTAERLVKEKVESRVVFAAYGEVMVLDGKPKYRSDTWSSITYNLNKAKPIAAWIYMASAGGGIIFLTFIILALCRYGFFARNTKEKLRTEKEKLMAEMEFQNTQEVQGRYEDQRAANVDVDGGAPSDKM